MNQKQSLLTEKQKRFWFPTKNITGPGGSDMSGGLQ